MEISNPIDHILIVAMVWLESQAHNKWKYTEFDFITLNTFFFKQKGQLK